MTETIAERSIAQDRAFLDEAREVRLSCKGSNDRMGDVLGATIAVALSRLNEVGRLQAEVADLRGLLRDARGIIVESRAVILDDVVELDRLRRERDICHGALEAVRDALAGYVALQRSMQADARRPVLCTAIIVPRAGRVLLLRRAPGNSSSGHWCLPGGRVEFGEPLVACARRELQEETGLDVAARDLVQTRITEEVVGDRHLIGVVYNLVMARTGFGAVEPVNAEPAKHDAIGWFGPGEWPRPMLRGAAVALGIEAALGERV